MSRVAKTPLNSDACSAADDAFYAAHPELVRPDGTRIPLGDGPEHAAYRSEWMDLYVANGGELEGDDPQPADDPVQPCDEHWIKFQFLMREDDLPLKGLRFTATGPDGTEIEAVTDKNGLFEITGCTPGAWTVTCPITDELTVADTFHHVSTAKAVAPVTGSQTGAPPARPDQPDPSSDPNTARAEALPWHPIIFAKVETHKVEDGDSLKSLGRKIGWTWEQVSHYNFSVTKPSSVNKQLRDLVGCTKRDSKGNYHFDSDDDPGLMFLPSEWKEDGLEVDQVHIFRGDPVERPVKLELQTVDGLGFAVGDKDLKLVTLQGKEIPIKTDAQGYWTDTIVLAGPVDVYHADGTRAKFFQEGYTAADQNGSLGAVEFEDARLEPTLVRRTISSIFVPGLVDEDRLVRRDTLRRRYGRLPGDRDAAKQVAAASGDSGGEAGDAGPDFDSKTPTVVTYRSINIAVDNVAAASVLDKDFFGNLNDWLNDRHGTTLGRGHFVMYAENDKLTVGDISSGKMRKRGTFKINPKLVYADKVEIDGKMQTLRNMYGAYAAFEIGRPLPVYFDLERRSKPLSDFDGEDDVTLLKHIITGTGNQEKFSKICDDLAPRVGVFYLFPENDHWMSIAAYFGFSGLLENYPSGPAASRAHARNRLSAQATDWIYAAELQGWINKMEKCKTNNEIRALGPPPEQYRYPVPAGATDDQIVDLFHDQGTTSFQAWKALSQHLAELEGQHSAGSVFFRSKFEFSNNVNAPIGGGAGKVSFNFDIGTDGHLEKIDKAVELAVGPSEAPIPGLKATGLTQMKREINPDTGETKDTLAIGLTRGKHSYGFEASSDGNTKFSGPYGTYSEFNSRTAEGGFGFCLDLQSLLEKNRKKKAEDEDTTPEELAWWKKIPNLQFCFGLHFVLIREDQLLSYFARAPGFFERRDMPDVFKCNWASLTGTEKGQLEVIGWTPETWDRRAKEDFPPATSKTYEELEAGQQVAAVKLGLTTLNWTSTWANERKKAVSRVTKDGGR